MDQICFSSDALCESFSGHMLKANMCTKCMKEISKHRKEVVKEDDLVKALECTQKGERTPSMVLDGDGKCGKVFLGGFKGVINKDFMSKEELKGVVNTVGDGLFALFGRKFQSTYQDSIKTNDINYLAVEWEDSLQYNISEDDLALVLRHMHHVRSNGGAVLVHCAQGKSRSTTAVVAYIMTIRDTNVEDTLSFVRERRKMAEPNPHFMTFLKKFESSELRASLKSEFS